VRKLVCGLHVPPIAFKLHSPSDLINAGEDQYSLETGYPKDRLSVNFPSEDGL